MKENISFPNTELPNDKLKKLLAELPEELASRQKERFEGNENKEEILRDIKEIIEERNSFLNEKFPYVPLDDSLNNPEKEQQATEIKKIIEDSRVGKLDKLGKGNVAKVFKSTNYPNFCYKIIYNTEQYKTENLITEEIRLMKKARKINTTNIKIPRPIYFIATKEEHIFVMETLDAITLEEAIAGKKDFPDNFNQETFFDELENFIEEQHENKIHHRDLHGENIMIDLETGGPCVIDYGKATELKAADDENPYLREVETAGGGEKGARTWLNDDLKIKQFRKEVSKKFE